MVDSIPNEPITARLTGRILFVSLPAAGLINPLLAVAAQLHREGRTNLWFASTEEGREPVERADGLQSMRFVSLGRFDDNWPDIWSDQELRSMSQGRRLHALSKFLDLNIDYDYDERQYERMLGVIEEVRPELIVIDLNTKWAIDAAMTKGVPYILSMPMPASSMFLDRLPRDYPTPFSGLPRELSRRQRCDNAMFRLGMKLVLFRFSTIATTLRAFQRRKNAGLLNATGAASGYADAAKAILGYSVFDLEYPFPASPDHLAMVGSVVPRELTCAMAGTDLADWLAAHQSVIYIGFGTIMRLSRGQVDAILDVSARLADSHAVLWKVPKSQRALLPPDAQLPANLRVEEWVPSQHEVLAHPHVRVFFNHGGAQGVHEALHFGKPLLVLPFWMDCYDFAARVVDRGVGLAVANVDTPDRDELHRKLMRLLTEESFPSRAQELGRRLRAAGGVAAAAGIIRRSQDELAAASRVS